MSYALNVAIQSTTTDLRLRVTVGLRFIITGLIVGSFEPTTDPAPDHKSLNIFVNLVWGIVELNFHSIMVAFARSSQQIAPTTAAPISNRSAIGPIRRAATSRHDFPPRERPMPKPPVRHE